MAQAGPNSSISRLSSVSRVDRAQKRVIRIEVLEVIGPPNGIEILAYRDVNLQGWGMTDGLISLRETIGLE